MPKARRPVAKGQGQLNKAGLLATIKQKASVKNLLQTWYLFLQSNSGVNNDGCWNFSKKLRHFSFQTRENRSNVRFDSWVAQHFGAALDDEILTVVVKIHPFLAGAPTQDEQGKPLCASHLCHNSNCVNPAHIVLETQWVNQQRTFCQKAICPHTPQCLLDGSDYKRQQVRAKVFDPTTETYV